jgi:lipopolysaccharide transport system permease protein
MPVTQFLQLLRVKVFLNLRAESTESYLNYFWWVLEPILHMLVFYLVFTVLLQSGIENFVPFLLCGLVPWLWFAKTVTNASNSIVAAKSLLNQVAIPPVFFPMVVVCQDLIKQIPVMFVLLAFLLIFSIDVSASWLWVLLIMFVQLTLIAAVAVIVATLVPFVPDLRYLIATGLQLLMFASGIFYEADQVLLPEHRRLYLLNPIANLIENYRAVLMENLPPDFFSLSVILGSSALVLFLANVAMRRVASALPKATTV